MRPVLPRWAWLHGMAMVAMCGALTACEGRLDTNTPDETTPNNTSVGNNAVSNNTALNNATSNNATSNNTTPNNGAPNSTTPPELEVFGPPEMRRLTKAQYLNAVSDLFAPAEIRAPDDMVPDPVSNGAFAFSTVLSRNVSSPPGNVDTYARTADAVVKQAFADDGVREEIMGCAPENASDPCIDTFLEKFMTRAWSRPPSADEIARYKRVISVGEQELGLDAGLEFGVAAILESPHFIYRTHVGEPHPGTDKAYRYTSYEMADRLALMLWQSVPDEELLRAAAEGELLTEEGIRAQAARMLEDDRARDGVLEFFIEWFELDALDELSKDEDLFPQISTTLGPAMRHEIEYYFESRIFDQNIDWVELFTSRQVIVNDELRQVYGMTDPVEGDAWELRVIPNEWVRGGLLTSPGILALHSRRSRTSPTLRGLFILDRLLCVTIQEAPDDLNVDELAAPDGLETVRQWSDRLRTNDQCASCHNPMDGLGLAFERFDAIGSHRNNERVGLGDSAMDVPIDSTGIILGDEVMGAKDVGQWLRDSPRLKECLTKQLFRYANGRDELTGELGELSRIAKEFGNRGNIIKLLVLDIVAHQSFRFVAPPEQE